MKLKKQKKDDWAIDSVVDENLLSVLKELDRAMKLYKPMHSYEEGAFVLQEEVAEVIQEIRKKPSERDHAAIKEEMTQVCAMALRFLRDLT